MFIIFLPLISETLDIRKTLQEVRHVSIQGLQRSRESKQGSSRAKMCETDNTLPGSASSNPCFVEDQSIATKYLPSDLSTRNGHTSATHSLHTDLADVVVSDSQNRDNITGSYA